MNRDWYYLANGTQHGPISAAELKAHADAGKLRPTDLVWKGGMTAWNPAGKVQGLFPPAATSAVRGRFADGLDAESTARAPVAVAAPPAADPLDAEVTGAAPAARYQAPAGDPLDGQVTARRVTPGVPPRAGDDLDREVTRRGRPAADPAPLVPAVPAGGDLRGQVVDQFLITKRLGEGGMGVVYKATDQETEVEYALKVLPPALCADPRALADLKKEVATAHALTHQNLLAIRSLATSGSLTYLVMEYIDGESLEEYRLRKGRTISADDFKKIAPQLLSGLDYLHEKGIVHRDVKPQNIMITRNGEIKVTDYGIALSIKEQLRRGQSAEVIGTLCYNAPEQMRGGEVVDRRADIYAVGLMFYRLVTGRFPFNDRDRAAIRAWHNDERHQLANVGNPGLATVLQKALAVNPAARYASCRDMLKDLARYGLIESQDAEPAAPAVTGKAEQLLELTRLTRQLLQKRQAELRTDFNYPVVMKTDGGSYEIPKKDALSKFKAFGKKLTGGLVNPVEELANELDALQTRGQAVDPRVAQNVLLLIQEAERTRAREQVSIGAMVCGGVAVVGLLMMLVGIPTQAYVLAGLGFLMGMYGGFVGGMFTWRPYFKKRGFCNDVLHFLRKEPEGPKFN
jgi:serine/threonine protein kinase